MASDWAGVDRESQRAIRLNPNFAGAHALYGIALRKMGRFDQAIAEEKRAVELDPFSLAGNGGLGRALYMARQYDQAIEQARKTLEVDPTYILAHDVLGMAYLQESMYKEGTAEFQKALLNSPKSAMALSGLGYAHALAGRRAEAQMVLDRLTALSMEKYVPTGYFARVYAGLQDKDKAFEWLGKSFEDRSIGTALSTKVDPIFDPLRSDPRFQNLLRRMNLQP